MSKPRYQWWSYAKSMIRRYPDKVTQDEFVAVNAAIQETQLLSNGDIRMNIVRMVLINGTHSIRDAALKAYCSEKTAKGYHGDFIRSVGKHFSCKSLIPQ